MRAVGQVACEDGLRVGLGGLHVGLVEGRHLHEPAHERRGVLPQHEVAADVHGVLKHVGALGHHRRQHRGFAVEGGVGVGVVHDHRVRGLVAVEQVDVDLDVRHHALAVLAQALGDELLHPQAEDAAGLGRDIGKDVGRFGREVADEEVGQLHGRVRGAVLRADLLHLRGAAQHVAHVQAAQGRRHQAEHGEGREAAAHGGLAQEDAAEVALAGKLLKLAARVGDGYEVPAGVLLAHLMGHVLPDDLVQRHGLDGAARLARHDEHRVGVVHAVQDLADVDGGERVERGEAHLRVQRGAQLGDGHGRLGASALAEQAHVGNAVGEDVLGEGLDLVDGAGRVGGQVGPAHVVACALERDLAEVVERAVLRVHARGDVGLDEPLGGSGAHGSLTSQGRLSNQMGPIRRHGSGRLTHARHHTSLVAQSCVRLGDGCVRRLAAASRCGGAALPRACRGCGSSRRRCAGARCGRRAWRAPRPGR